MCGFGFYTDETRHLVEIVVCNTNRKPELRPCALITRLNDTFAVWQVGSTVSLHSALVSNLIRPRKTYIRQSQKTKGPGLHKKNHTKNFFQQPSKQSNVHYSQKGMSTSDLKELNDAYYALLSLHERLEEMQEDENFPQQLQQESDDALAEVSKAADAVDALRSKYADVVIAKRKKSVRRRSASRVGM